MGTCVNHPDRETPYLCMKHNKYLCEECLACQDPDIYCKFRSSCAIWFLTKRKGNLDGDESAPQETVTEEVTITFSSEEKTVSVPKGTTLLEAARQADVYVNAACNGKGSCGKCKLVVSSGQTEDQPSVLLSDAEKEKGYVLACQSRVVSDVSADIPPEIRERKLKVAGMGEEATRKLKGTVTTIDPMLREIPMELPPPSLDDAVSDLERVHRGLKKEGIDPERLNVGIKVIRELANAVREDDWKLTASVIQRKCSHELLEIRAGVRPELSYGLAIDLGTTTIVVYLVNMADGKVEAASSGHNRQAACGDDVINRMICAEKDGTQKLSRMVLSTINSLVGEVAHSAGISASQITSAVVSGNTTMTHLLLEIEPRYIRREPYIPTVTEFPIFKAGNIGLKAHPMAAVFIMPGPASYVGGDIVSGVLSTGIYRDNPLTLFIDIGTNGEIVLGNKEWMMTSACSAGPAFEGGGIRWGMRAEQGAIEKVQIDTKSFEPIWSTVEDAPPRGICGSGMIDLISELLRVGLIDPRGKFNPDIDHPRIGQIKEEPVYILANASQTPMGEDIVFSESDIKNLIYSKGAVYAGFTTLLAETGLDFAAVDRIIIAGGFGQYLNIEKAVTIGLLPDIDRTKYVYVGNTSISGAYMALLSQEYRQAARQICHNMTYMDFSSNNKYMDEFTSALFLPHTNLGMFPSVVRAN